MYKHLNKDNQFIDDLDSANPYDPIEKEADEIASEALIPKVIWKKSPSLNTAASVENFAKKLNINPAIIAGRIRFESKDYTKLNN